MRQAAFSAYFLAIIACGDSPCPDATRSVGTNCITAGLDSSDAGMPMDSGGREAASFDAPKQHGIELTPPEFEVVSADITQERLAAELPDHFPDLDVLVDDDIDA